MKKLKQHFTTHWKTYLIVLLVLVLLFKPQESFLATQSFESYDSYKGGYAESIAIDSRGISPYYGGYDDALDVSDRKVIKNGNINLETTTYESSKTSLQNSVKAAGGIILSETESTNTYDDRYLNLRAKVDSEKIDAVLEELKQYGEVQYFNVYTHDITGSYVDYTDRKERYETQITKYTILLEKEDITVEEEIQIQSRIDSLEDQLFYVLRQLGNLDEDVAYSEIYVTLSEKPSVLDEVDFLGLRESFKTFMQSLENGIRFLLDIIGFLIPFVVLYAIYRIIRRPHRK